MSSCQIASCMRFSSFVARVSPQSSRTHMHAVRLREGGAGVDVPPVDAAAHMASSVLLEAVEAAEGEAPGPAADAVPVCVDAGAKVLSAEGFVVDERHFFWISGSASLVRARDMCRGFWRWSGRGSGQWVMLARMVGCSGRCGCIRSDVVFV